MLGCLVQGDRASDGSAEDEAATFSTDDNVDPFAAEWIGKQLDRQGESLRVNQYPGNKSRYQRCANRRLHGPLKLTMQGAVSMSP